MDGSSIEIRSLVAADQRFAWELNQSEVPHVGAATLEEFQRLCAISKSSWVGLVSGAPAGFLLGMTPDAPYESPNFQWFRERYSDFLYVDRLAVAAANRGRGVASALYAKAEADARSLGLRTLCCEVNLRPPNPGSLAFHQRSGFAQAGEQEAHGKLVTMMTKVVALSPHPHLQNE